MTIRIQTYSGPNAKHLVDSLGALRIAVFKEFPYLYDGNLDYERSYLNTYLACEKSFIAVVFDGESVVGASTAIPMANEEQSFKEPFIARGYDPQAIVYFGESILLSSYRGCGFGKEFFRLREEYALSLPQHKFSCFCAVVRAHDDPRAPEGYRPLDSFWRSWGYTPVDGLTAHYNWKEIGEPASSDKKMQFWLKQHY